jgi:putative flippase GtrA
MGSLGVVAPSSVGDLRRRGLVRRWHALPTIVRYGLAGGVTQTIYLTTMAVALWSGTHYLGALVLAQVAAITFAFPTYRNLVFVAEGSVLRQLGTFMGVWWTGAAMSLVGVPALVEIAGLPPLVAQLAVLTIVVLMSYLGHRTMTFSGSASDVPPGPSC